MGRVRVGCIGIDDDHGATIHLCHVLPAAGLDRKDRVEAGEVIGSVAPDGVANNNGIAHIHMAVFVGGRTVPFTGLYAIEGRAYAATSAWNAHYGELLLSSNSGDAPNSGAGAFSVEIGEDFEVAAGATVTLTAQAGTSDQVLAYEWSQIAGPPVAVGESGRTISFVAPAEPGATLIFRAIGLSTFQRTGSDSIVIVVEPNGTAPAPAAAAPGEILGGGIPTQEFGLIVSAAAAACSSRPRRAVPRARRSSGRPPAAPSWCTSRRRGSSQSTARGGRVRRRHPGPHAVARSLRVAQGDR